MHEKEDMSTFLFDEIVFGPVKSRRLGVSLGVNLLPIDCKLCNFNCIYCECGLSDYGNTAPKRLPSRSEVYTALDVRLGKMKREGIAPDVITFAGNGEPTLNPDFPGIIDDTIALRNKYFPTTTVAVLSNATTIGNPEVKRALLSVDSNILKLDSAIDATVLSHNQPEGRYDTARLIEGLVGFNGQVMIQTLFVRGTFNGRVIDNTTEEELTEWLKALHQVKPKEVMIYTISRDTPIGGHLQKVPVDELNEIASRVGALGLKTQVSG